MHYLFLFLTLSWAQAGVPGQAGKPRPVPIEPDAPNKGDFRVMTPAPAPEPVPAFVPAPKVETPSFEVAKPKKNVVPDGVEDTKPKVPAGAEGPSNVWKADASGNFWARDAYGNWFYGPDSETVRTKGQPYNR